MDATHFATMPQPKLARVATALMEEVVALKGLVGKESPVAKAYAELDAAHQAERDMLRRAVRPLNVWKFCLESTEYSALKSMGGKRSDCAAVMCGVASLLGDIGVCMPPTAMGRAGALMYKVPDPVLFIDLCGEEESTDDEDQNELSVASTVTVTKENVSQDEELAEEASAAAVPCSLELTQTVQPDPLPSVTANDFDLNSGVAWRNLGDAKGGTVDGEKYTAAQCYERAIEINSKDFLAWLMLGSNGGGRVNGTCFNAVECMTQFLQNDDADDDTYNCNFVLAWGTIGVQGGGSVGGTYYNASECLAKAIELVDKCRPEQQPEVIRRICAPVWRKLGLVEGGRVNGIDYTPAQCFAKALEIQPEPYSWCDLGAAGGGLVRGQNYTPAQCYGKFLEIEPLNSAAWNVLGNAGGGDVLGRTYTAAECYIKVLELKDENDTVMKYSWRALGLDGGGGRVNGKDYTPAQCYAKALEIQTDEDTWYVLGLAGGGLVSGQNYTPAQCFGRALEIDPLCITTWKALADAGGGDVFGRTYSATDCKVKASQSTMMRVLPKTLIKGLLPKI